MIYLDVAVATTVTIGSKVKGILDPDDPLGRRSILVLANEQDYIGVVVRLPSHDDPYCAIEEVGGTASPT